MPDPGAGPLLHSEQLFLEQHRFTLERAISNQALDRLGSYTARTLKGAIRDPGPGQEMWDRMVVEITGDLLRRRVAGDRQELRVQIPATWRQHLKASVPSWLSRLLGRTRGPRWLRRAWRVRVETVSCGVSFAQFDTYPMADLQLPPDEMGFPVRVDWTVFDPVANPTGYPASAVSSGVSPGRRFADERRLAVQLARAAQEKWLERTACLPGEDKPLIPWLFIAQAALEELRRLGVHTGGLVQEYALTEAEMKT